MFELDRVLLKRAALSCSACSLISEADLGNLSFALKETNTDQVSLTKVYRKH